MPQDDPKQRQPDIALARAQLGWEPRVALEEGLQPTIGYFATRVGGDTALQSRREAIAEQQQRLARAFP